MTQSLARSDFAGAALQQQQRQCSCSKRRIDFAVVAAVKKVNSYDEGWRKGMVVRCLGGRSPAGATAAATGAAGGGLHTDTLLGCWWPGARPPVGLSCTAHTAPPLHGSFPAPRSLLALAGIGSMGLFQEEREQPSVNIFKQVEKKKLMSSVEKAGLLS